MDQQKVKLLLFTCIPHTAIACMPECVYLIEAGRLTSTMSFAIESRWEHINSHITPEGSRHIGF